MIDEWPFDQAPNVAAITTAGVLSGAAILAVVHYSDDDSWAFLDGSEVTEDLGRVIGMGTALKMDPSLRDVADLPPGWRATRHHVRDQWQRRPDPSV